MKLDELKVTARSLSEQIAKDKVEAKKLGADADAMLKAAIKEGTVGSKEFNDKYEEALKPYLAAQDEIDEKQRGYDTIMRQLSAEAGADPGDPLATGSKMRETAESLGIGERFIKSEVYAELKKRLAVSIDSAKIGDTSPVEIMTAAETKTLITSLAASAGALVLPDRRDGIIPLPLAPLTILDLITTTTTDSDIVEFVREKTRTNAAAETANDGAASAPESALAFEVVQQAVKEIPHWIPATRRILDDAPRLSAWINSFLVDGCRRRLMGQVISGDGIGENLRGLHNITGVLSQAKGTLDWADAILKAITLIRIAGQGQFEPTVIGMHPNDYEAARLARDEVEIAFDSTGVVKRTISTGSYLLGPVTSGAMPTIWGLLPVVHVGFPQGNPLVGDYKLAELAIRSGVAVSMSDSHSDYFIKRLVAMLATIRAAFGTNFPGAFAEITP